MPRQNRVTPCGELIATPARGTLMGNRGILHDDQGAIVRTYANRSWIACALSFKGRTRQIMTPGRYTELFFLDEATALAAGHRPCGECRHGDYRRFKRLWAAVTGIDEGALTHQSMDRILHAERLAGKGDHRRKPTFPAVFGSIPEGTLFRLGEQDPTAYLKWKGRPLAWTPGGYVADDGMSSGQSVDVLTPKTTLHVIQAGYVPRVHGSADEPLPPYKRS